MPVGDSFDLSGETKVSEAESREHQATLLAKRTMDIPSDMQVLADAASRADNQPVYVGIGARSLGQSTSGWLIIKLTYDSNGDFSTKQTAYDSWANRTTATYA